MADTSGKTAREWLREAIALAPGSPMDALAVIDRGLEAARAGRQRAELVALASHAGVIATESGDPVRAAAYYDEALSIDPNNAYLHFVRGHVCRLLADRRGGADALRRSIVLAGEQGDEEMVAMASAALAQVSRSDPDDESNN